jgi:uncharacterized membrane protein YdbT with pleckstrin-like domain
VVHHPHERAQALASDVRHYAVPLSSEPLRLFAYAMSSYIEAALVPGERLVHQGRLSLWSAWHLLLIGLVLLPVFGIGLAFWLTAYIRIKSTELAVTTKRLIVKHGFIRRSTMEINIGKVESIQVSQSMTGRLLGFGTLVIAGTGTSHAPLHGIADPMSFRRAFVQAQDGAGTDAT